MNHFFRALMLTVGLLIVPVSTNGHDAVFTLDIDDSGDVQPLSDGLLILRHLLGFSGASLTTGATGAQGPIAQWRAIAARTTREPAWTRSARCSHCCSGGLHQRWQIHALQ